MRHTRTRLQFALLALAIVAVALWARDCAFAGRVVAWGWNYYEQCDVPAGNDFVAVSACWKHSLALRSDGSIEGWGQNNHGQSDPPAGNDFVAISAGGVHSLALRADGSLVAWGYNGNGERDVPAGNDYVAIAAGHDHNLALKSDGSVVAWGNNDEGQCDVLWGHDIIAIAAGYKYSLYLRAEGRIIARGGIDPWPHAYLYTVPSDRDFVAMAAGGFINIHSLGLKSDGSIKAWGSNEHRQCDVPEGNDFVAIAAGTSHSVALRSDGTVVAWGLNDKEQCDVPSAQGFVAVAAGSSHSVALFEEPGAGRPTADAGNDIVAAANEEVILDAGNSSDPDGEITLYTWTRLPDDVVLCSGGEPTCTTRALGRAEEVIELTVTDNDLATATDTVTIINRILYRLLEQADGAQLGDLNLDRQVNLADIALLAEHWLK
jgi:hypothetical protein